MSIPVATANVRKELKGAQVTHAVRAALPADLIGFQEVETKAHVNAVAHIQKGYATVWPGGTRKLNARNATPITYKTSEWRLKQHGCLLAVPGVAKISPSRYTVWALFAPHHPGDWTAFICVHALSGKDKHTGKVKGWKNHTRQFMWNIHMKQVRNLVAKIEKQHPFARIIVVGDFNEHNKLGKAQVGLPVHYADQPTHGGPHGSWFDLIATNRRVTHVYRRTNTPSDHDVLVAQID